VKGVLNKDLDVDRALAVHKLAKNISDSIYSETKIAMFHHSLEKEVGELGTLRLGDPDDDK